MASSSCREGGTSGAVGATGGGNGDVTVVSGIRGGSGAASVPAVGTPAGSVRPDPIVDDGDAGSRATAGAEGKTGAGAARTFGRAASGGFGEVRASGVSIGGAGDVGAGAAGAGVPVGSDGAGNADGGAGRRSTNRVASHTPTASPTIRVSPTAARLRISDPAR